MVVILHRFRPLTHYITESISGGHCFSVALYSTSWQSQTFWDNGQAVQTEFLLGLLDPSRRADSFS